MSDSSSGAGGGCLELFRAKRAIPLDSFRSFRIVRLGDLLRLSSSGFSIACDGIERIARLGISFIYSRWNDGAERLRLFDNNAVATVFSHVRFVILSVDMSKGTYAYIVDQHNYEFLKKVAIVRFGAINTRRLPKPHLYVSMELNEIVNRLRSAGISSQTDLLKTLQNP